MLPFLMYDVSPSLNLKKARQYSLIFIPIIFIVSILCGSVFGIGGGAAAFILLILCCTLEYLNALKLSKANLSIQKAKKYYANGKRLNLVFTILGLIFCAYIFFRLYKGM